MERKRDEERSGTGRRAPGRTRTQVFRHKRYLTWVFTVAALLWAGVLIYLLRFDGVPVKLYAMTSFFVVFFGVAVTYYARTSIVLDDQGFTYRGMVRTRHVSYADIRKVEVLPGPLTVYAVRGGGREVHFTSLFQRHKRLVRELLEHAQLAPAH